MAVSSQFSRRLELPYRWRDIDGTVRVEMRENDNPAALGCPELARGFPSCRATVHHAFLCGLGGELHEARAILGFSGGFSKDGTGFEFFGPDPLEAGAWDLHRDYLAGAFSTWTFAPGFFEHPLEP